MKKIIYVFLLLLLYKYTKTVIKSVRFLFNTMEKTKKNNKSTYNKSTVHQYMLSRAKKIKL